MSRKFSKDAEKIISNAQKYAIELGAKELGTVHFLFSLLEDKDIIELLKRLEFPIEKIRLHINKLLEESNEKDVLPVKFSNSAERMLIEAYKEAKLSKFDLIFSEHLFLAILKDECEVLNIIKQHNVDVKQIITAIAKSLEPQVLKNKQYCKLNWILKFVSKLLFLVACILLLYELTFYAVVLIIFACIISAAAIFSRWIRKNVS